MLDLEQAQAHLQALGYKPEELVYLRLIGPDRARKLELPVRDLGQLQPPAGWGVYFAVNAAHTDNEVASGRALFAEWDDRDLGWQLRGWQELGLPEPTVQVNTTNKSVHSYWRLKEPVSPRLWKELQADLLEFVDADRSLKNPSRCMRLAGSVHPKTGRMAHIVSCSGAVYSYEELRRIIPRQPEKTPEKNGQVLPYFGDEILLCCLSVEHRRFVEFGVPEGTRNSSGFALACDLIGTADWLAQRGIHTEPRRLFELFCDRCQPPLPQRERDSIWASAERAAPAPCLSSDRLEACLRAALRSANGHGGRRELPVVASSNGDGHRMTEAHRRMELGTAPEPFDAEGEVTPEVVGQLLEEYQRPFPVQKLIDPKLAAALGMKARTFGLPEDYLVIPLLTVCGSLTCHELLLAEGFRVPAILWAGIVAGSGSGKTPLLESIVKPLHKMQKEAYERYETALEDWESACQRLGKNDERPPKPTRRYYYISDATWESIPQALQRRNHCLVYSDELTGFVNSLDQYKSRGRGSDRQRWLSAYNGLPVDILRVGKSLHIPSVRLSILGGVQPQVLRRLISADGDYVDGFWSRFCFFELPNRKTPCPVEMPNVNLDGLLEHLYRNLDRWAETPITFRLCSQGKRIWAAWWDEIESLRLGEFDPLLQAMLPKTRERAARFAVVAHCINTALADTDPGEVIPPETLESAIELARWSLRQCKKVFAGAGHTTTPHAERLSSFIQNFAHAATITPLQVRSWWPEKKKPPLAECRRFMDTLVRLGYAAVVCANPESPKFAIRIQKPAAGGLTTVDETLEEPPKTPPSALPAVIDELPVNGHRQPAHDGPPAGTSGSKPTNGRDTALRTGDAVSYIGPRGDLKVQFRHAGDVRVVAIEGGKARCKAPQWIFAYDIPIEHLRRK